MAWPRRGGRALAYAGEASQGWQGPSCSLFALTIDAPASLPSPLAPRVTRWCCRRSRERRAELK